ncbi:MAG: NADH:flavin oxidoreductase [Bacteroidia bacterium]|nr:NADH:flavin oxidoreductase [Bacteroidia bacterium]
MKAFEAATIAGIKFRNRIIRSATYEGMCDEQGFPTAGYYAAYENLAKADAGGLITGFAYVSKEGRAMQPAQAGIDSPDKIAGFRILTDRVHRYGCPVILQIAHTGRQTIRRRTGMPVRGSSSKRSVYFRSKPVPFSTAEIYDVINRFADAALYARDAGFDGIQVHAAHGYLVHQFLLRGINNRRDEFGIDPKTGIGNVFLEAIIGSIRKRCGDDFPVFVKISGGINDEKQFGYDQFMSLVRVLDRLQVAAIEISYGTMDNPFNIFRGEMPVRLILSKNPFFKTNNPLRRSLNKAIIELWFRSGQLPFSPGYNLTFARQAKSMTGIPIIVVGGFRNPAEIEDVITSKSADLVSLSRPFVAEPDIVIKMKNDLNYTSLCANCNYCSVMCDSGEPTKCYKS